MRRLSLRLGLAGIALLAGCMVVHKHEHTQKPKVMPYTDCTTAIYREYFGCDDDTVAFLVKTKLDPTDIFVLLTIAHFTHHDIHVVANYYRKEHDLSKVSTHFKCKPEVFVAFLPGQVHVGKGPPYGRAYGYYKKHGRVDSLTHAELRDWVELRLMMDYYHHDPEEALRWKEDGKPFHEFAVSHYEESGNGRNVRGQPVVKKERPWENPGDDEKAGRSEEHRGDKHEEKHTESHQDTHQDHQEDHDQQIDKHDEQPDESADPGQDKDSGKDKKKDKKKGQDKKGQQD